MLVSGLVAVVLLDNLVHQQGEGLVRVVTSSVDTDAGVNVLGTREDCLTESETESILEVGTLVPDLSSQELAQKRLGSSREHGEASDVLGLLEVRAGLDISSGGILGLLGSGKSLFGINHSFDTVVHVLNEVNFRAAESSLVGNVIDVVVSLSVLAMSSTNLDVVFVGNSLELILLAS